MSNDLIQQILDGDRDAYADIVREHRSMLMAYAAYRLADRTIVEEVVQLTFIRAYEQLADFREDGDFGVWLRVICRYVILAELKRRTRDTKRHATHRDQLQQLLDQTAAAQAEADDGTADLRQHLKHCLAELSEQSRDVVRLRYHEGLSCAEVAKTCDRSVSWVTTVLARVRSGLRKCINGRLREAADG